MKSQDEGSQELMIGKLSQLDFLGFEQKKEHLLAYAEEGGVALEKVEAILAGEEWTSEVLVEINWNEEWERSFDPIELEALRIRAHFHESKEDGKEEIIITPRMSFGTGHHSTTQLMLMKMNELEFQDKSVLDFGTGTGLLAIYARRKGAQKIHGIDIDPWSVDNAKDNLVRNECEDIVIELGGIQEANGQYDIVLANINLNVIKQSLAKLHSCVKMGGEVLFSGILTKDLENLKKAVDPLFVAHSSRELNDWNLLYCKKI